MASKLILVLQAIRSDRIKNANVLNLCFQQ